LILANRISAALAPSSLGVGICLAASASTAASVERQLLLDGLN
jgi:hypothetical protein